MTQYTAPLRDMNFVLNELAGLAHVAKLPGFEEAGPETVEAILDEAARFASQVLAPINAEGDAVGCTWKDGEVTTLPGFRGRTACWRPAISAGALRSLVDFLLHAFRPDQFAGVVRVLVTAQFAFGEPGLDEVGARAFGPECASAWFQRSRSLGRARWPPA